MARCKLSGARSISSFSLSNLNYRNFNTSSLISIPNPTALTYEGIINENTFQSTGPLPTEVFDIQLSQSSTINPITNQREQWLGLFTRSIYDGVSCREPIDIVIALDISGSMDGIMNIDNKSGKSRLDFSIEASLKLFDLLTPQDNISYITFNSESNILFPLTPGNKLNKFIKKVMQIKSYGGTKILEGVKTAYEILQKSTSKNKRIILITDMEDDDYNHLKELLLKCSTKGIYTTIIGISDECNTALAESVIHIRGNNYFVAAKEDDIKRFLVEDFNYICFPSAFDIQIDFRSSNLQVTKCKGCGNINSKPIEVQETNNEWLTKTHMSNCISFQSKCDFLLMYFNRIKRKMPMPVIATLFNFLRYDKKTICNLNTAFPSQVIKKDDLAFVEGGMVLMKLEKMIQLKEYSCEIEVRYSTVDGINKTKRVPFVIKAPLMMNDKYEDMFTDENIRKGLGLYYYAKFCRKMMRFSKRNGNENDHDEEDLMIGNKVNRITKNVNEYMKRNVINCKKDVLKDYEKKMKLLVKNVKKYAKENDEEEKKNLNRKRTRSQTKKIIK